MPELLQLIKSTVLQNLDQNSSVSQSDFIRNEFQIGHQELLKIASDNQDIIIRSSKDLVPSNHTGAISEKSLFNMYNEGHTIVLQGLNKAGLLQEFASKIESFFYTQVSINAYISPPNSRGFPRHWDPHDVLVLQTEGLKTWLLGEAPVWNTLSEEVFHEASPLFREKLQKIKLRSYEFSQGVVAYIPRGTLHEVYTTEHSSVHLTIGLPGFALMDRWIQVPNKQSWNICHESIVRKSALRVTQYFNFDKVKALYDIENTVSLQTDEKVLHFKKHQFLELLQSDATLENNPIFQSLLRNGVINAASN